MRQRVAVEVIAIGAPREAPERQELRAATQVAQADVVALLRWREPAAEVVARRVALLARTAVREAPTHWGELRARAGAQRRELVEMRRQKLVRAET